MNRKVKLGSSKKILPKEIAHSNREIVRIQALQTPLQTIAKKYNKDKKITQLDRLRTISMINIQKPGNLKSRRNIRYRKKVASIIDQSTVNYRKVQKIRHSSIKIASDSTRTRERKTLPKIEEKNQKQIDQRYVLPRPKTSINGHYKQDQEKTTPLVSSEHQPSPLPQHKKKISQCKIIKCPKLPFPLPRPVSRRQKIVSNLDNVIAQFDQISEIKMDKNESECFVTPESQFLINF